MAKQTFTTGQVLSATQVNGLQTNDFNQTVSPKTASYVLVAADAGTRITMNSASATTVTVNTALFAAGDTLQITNLGAGVLTITAGTATVSTAGVLTLAQNASGSLYFTSTGVSIWDGSAAIAASATILSARKTSTQTITSSTTLTNDTQLFVAIPANEIYFFRMQLHVTTAVGAINLKFSCTGPTGSTIVYSQSSQVKFNTAGATALNNIVASGVPTSAYVDNDPRNVEITGTIVNGATAGNLQLQFAQDTSNVVGIVMGINSTLFAIKGV